MLEQPDCSRVSWLGLVELTVPEGSWLLARGCDDVTRKVILLQDNSSMQRHVATPGGAGVPSHHTGVPAVVNSGPLL